MPDATGTVCVTGGTGLTLSAAGDMSVDAAQTQIISVGTIGTGVWQGTAVADTYVANDLTISAGTVNNSIIGGTTPAAGTFTTLNLTNSLSSYAVGLINNISTSVIYSSGADIRSGAMNVPANSLITGIHAIVTTQLIHGTGTTGIKVGSSADGVGIVADDVDAIQTDAINTIVGKGTSTNSNLALGAAAISIVAGQSYRSANTEVHITIDNSAGNMSAGAIKFVVEYVKLA